MSDYDRYTIKPLKWENCISWSNPDPDEPSVYIDLILGARFLEFSYNIYKAYDGYKTIYCFSGNSIVIGGCVSSIEEAKEIARQHYIKMILSVLEEAN